MVGFVKGIGVGTAVGAGAGAVASDDGYGAGALRGGIAGAVAGAGVAGVPRMINAAYSKAGFTKPPEGAFSNYANTLMDTYKPTYDVVNTEANKELMKSFIPGVKAANKTATSDGDFALKTIESMAKTYKGMKPEDIKRLANVGEIIAKDSEKLEGNKNISDFTNYMQQEVKKFQGLSGGLKVGVMTTAAIDGGIGSVKSHLIDPMVSMGKKIGKGDFRGINKFEYGAAGFNALGVYETGSAVNDIADGNYGSAAGSLALLGAGKLAYSQGANVVKGLDMLHGKGMTVKGAVNAGVAGGGMYRMNAGIKSWTPEQQARAQEILGGF